MSFKLSILLVLVVVVTIHPASSRGQATDRSREVDLAVTYLEQRSNITPGQFFWRQGGALEGSTEIYHGLEIAGSLSGSEANNIQGTGVDLNAFTATFGPRYTWYPRGGNVSVFGQSLVGISHAWNSRFPQATGAVSSSSTFALQAGGGVDVRISRRFSVRAIEADWLRTQFPNATTTVQNTLQLGAGVVLRLPY
jgi:hypothetical protein